MRLVPYVPATPRAGERRMVGWTPLIPPSAASERLYPVTKETIDLETPAAAGVPRRPPAADAGSPDASGEGNPVLDQVRKLLRQHAPELLGSYWTVERDPAGGGHTGGAGGQDGVHGQLRRLENILNLQSLTMMMDQLLGPGIVLHPIRSGFGHNERVQIVLRARRDPHNQGYVYLESVEGNTVRYTFGIDLKNKSWTRLKSGALGTASSPTAQPNIRNATAGPTGVGGTPNQANEPDTGFDTWELHPEGALTQTTGKGGYEQRMDAQRDTMFAAGRADRYGGDVALTISLTRTWQPSITANALGLNLPHLIGSQLQNTARPSRKEHTAVVSLKERVLIPHAVIHHELGQEPPPPGTAAVEEVEVVPGPAADALPITVQDLHDRKVLHLGVQHEKIVILHDELGLRLTGTQPPVSGQSSHAVARLAETGTISQDQISYMISPPVFHRYLDKMLGAGMTMPGMVRPGGPLTDTQGELKVQVEFLKDPLVLGNFTFWDEAVPYSFDEHGQTLTRSGGWTLGLTGGAGYRTGDLHRATPRAPNVTSFSFSGDVGSSMERSITAIQQTMTRVDALNRSGPWLRIAVHARITVIVKARNERDWIKLRRLGKWLGGGEVAVAFLVRNAFEFAVSPEASIKLGVYHPGGIPVGSGTFFPPPPERRPASPDDLVRASNSVPFLEGAFGVQIDWDGRHFLAGDKEIDATQLAAAINDRLAQLGDPPAPDIPEEERPPPAPTKLKDPNDPIVLISPSAAVIAPGHTVSPAQALADAIGRPVLAPNSPYVITRDGAVLAVRQATPDATDFGRDWHQGNWVAVFPRSWAEEPRPLPHSELTDAINAARAELGWTLQAGGRPDLVPPPTRNVLYPAQTPQDALGRWRDDVAAADRLVEAASELRPHIPPDLADGLDRAVAAVRAVPAPPRALPAATPDRAAIWQHLTRFQDAASDLGRAVYDALDAAFSRWQDLIDPAVGLPDRARALLPRSGAPGPELAAALARLDAAASAIPRPPERVPATAEQISDAVSVIARIQDGRPQRAAVDAFSAVLTLAARGRDQRAADATEMATAAYGLLRFTGQHEANLRQRLGAARRNMPPRRAPRPGLPGIEDTISLPGSEETSIRVLGSEETFSLPGTEQTPISLALTEETLSLPESEDSVAEDAQRARDWLAQEAQEELSLPPSEDTSPEDARLELEQVAALEDVIGSVFAAATELDELPSRSAAVPHLLDAAEAMLPYTGEQQGEIAIRLSQARHWHERSMPGGWWGADGPELTRPWQVRQAEQWLAGNGPDQLRGAVQYAESLASYVTSAATQAAEQYERLVRNANELLPQTGAQQHTLGLALYTARGIPAGTRFTAPRLPELRPRPPDEAAEAATQIRAAAEEHASFYRDQVPGLVDVVRRVLHAATTQWLTRLNSDRTRAERLLELAQGPGQQRELLAHDLRQAGRVTRVFADRISALRHGTVAELDAAAIQLAGLASSYEEEAVISEAVEGLVDEPRRAAEAARKLADKLKGLLAPGADPKWESGLESHRAQLQRFSMVPEDLATLSRREMELVQVRLDQLHAVLPEFTAFAADLFRTQFEPERLMRANEAAGQVRQVLDLLGRATGRMDGEQQRIESAALNEQLAKLAVAGEPPEAAGRPNLQQMAARLNSMRSALDSLAEAPDAERFASRALAELTSGLTAYTRRALERASQVRGLGPRAGTREADLLAALEQAEQDAGALLSQAQQPRSIAQAIEHAGQWLDGVNRLEDVIWNLFGAATAEAGGQQAQVTAAEDVARAARPLLPRAGWLRSRLTGRLDQATGRLRKIKPAWWPGNGTDLVLATAEQFDAALQGVADAPRLRHLAWDIRATVDDLLRAVDAESWQQAVADARDMASRVQELPPHTGEQRAALEAAIQRALTRMRADRSARALADWQAMRPRLSDDQLAPELQRLLPRLAAVTDLEDTVNRAVGAATKSAQQRAAFLTTLLRSVRELLPFLPPGPLHDDLSRAEQMAGRLLGPRARPSATAEAIDTVREALEQLAAAQRTIETVLAQAAPRLLPALAQTEEVFAAAGAPRPLSRRQREDLRALVGHIQSEPDAARLDVGTVRQGAVALTALRNNASVGLNPVALRRRAQAAIELAETALELRQHPVVASELALAADGAADIAGAMAQVQGAMQGLPEGQVGLGDAGAFGQAMTAVTDLETAARPVVAVAAGRAEALRQEVETAAALARAAQEPLSHTGHQRAVLTARLNQGASWLGPDWLGRLPAAGAVPATGVEREAVRQALADHDQAGDAARAVTGTVADVLAAFNVFLGTRARSDEATGTAAQDLLRHAGDQQATLTALLEDARVQARRIQGQVAHPATLTGVEAAVRDLSRVIDVGAGIMRVIARATDRLRERVAAAPALARSAGLLLDQLGAQDRTDLQQNRPTLDDDLDPATLPALAGLPPGRPTTVAEVAATARVLDRVAAAEAAGADVLTAAIGRLDRSWREAQERVAAARALLSQDGPGQPALSARLDAAASQPHEVFPAGLRAALGARLTPADLDTARQALTGQARSGTAKALGASTRRLNRAAEAVFDTAPARWRRLRELALDRQAEARRLYPGLESQQPGPDQPPQELRIAVEEHDRALARAEARVIPAWTSTERRPAAATAEITSASHEMRVLGDATGRLTIALRATAWWRADALLGPGHAFSSDQAEAVVALADLLVPDSLRARPDEENFSWLAGEVGLHHQDDEPGRIIRQAADRPAVARLFALLLLASQVHGGIVPTRGEVANLRRLIDIVRARLGRRQEDITLQDLGDEHRRLHGRPAGLPVSADEVRELAEQIGRVKSAGPGERRGPRQVTGADLEALAGAGRLVERARGYLAADPSADLDEQERSDLIWRLVNLPLATEPALRAALELLQASRPDDLRRLFQDGTLMARLLAAIPDGHLLRGALGNFALTRFGVHADQLTLRDFGTGPTPMEQPFQPAMLAVALTTDASRDLGPQELDDAVRVLAMRGWQYDSPQRSGRPLQGLLRPLGLSPEEEEKAENWLDRLADAAERRDRIRGHFSGDPDLALGTEQQWQEIDALLRSGISRWSAVRLIVDAADPDLRYFVGQGLMDLLESGIRPGHPYRSYVDQLRSTRLHGAEMILGVIPARPFQPGLISPRLAGLGIRADLEPASVVLLGQHLAGRSRADVAAALSLNQEAERARFDWWWDHVAEPAQWVNSAQEFLQGAPALRNYHALQRLVSYLAGLEHTQWQALELLEGLEDSQLPALLDGRLRDGLLRAIPVGHPLRPRLTTILSRWRSIATSGASHRTRLFMPALISRSLGGVGPYEELTGEQVMAAGEALAGRSDAVIVGSLGLSSQIERGLAERWLRGVREAMADLVMRYLDGTPGFGLSVARLRSLAGWLLTDQVTARGRRVVLALLGSIDDDQLAAVFDDELRRLLEEAIADETGLVPRLEAFFAGRLTGTGQVRTGVYPPRAFSPGVLGPELAGVRADHELTPQVLDQVRAVLRTYPSDLHTGPTSGLLEELVRMAPVQQARARAWLARVRLALHDRAAGDENEDPQAGNRLDDVLGVLYAQAARQIPGPGELDALAVTPPASQRPRLRQVLAGQPARPAGPADLARPRRLYRPDRRPELRRPAPVGAGGRPPV